MNMESESNIIKPNKETPLEKKLETIDYKKVVSELINKQNETFGGFTPKLPDLNNLPIKEAQEILAERIHYLDNVINQIPTHEVSRFINEYGLVRLLLVIYILAEVNTEIPLTEDGLGVLINNIHDSIHGVGAEEGSDTTDATKFLIAEAKKTFKAKELPANLKLLTE